MNFKNRENKEYKTTCGETIWKSRSVAVCVCVIRTSPDDESVIQVLGIKRGKAVTHEGKYCFPCGYLDWDETVPQAAARELYEETGLEIDFRDLDFYELDSNPEKFSQNVAVHFVLYYTGKEVPHFNNAAADEITEVRWLDFEQAEKLDWAFDHKTRIENLIKNCAPVKAEKE